MFKMIKTRSAFLLRDLLRGRFSFGQQPSVFLGQGFCRRFLANSYRKVTSLTTEHLSPTIRVVPESSLADEALDIRVSGLRSGQEVTLRASTRSECEKYKFESRALYKANKDGEISVENDPSLSGSYRGIEPHGLLWSLQPTPDVADKYPRFVKYDLTTPFRYTIDLLDHGMEENGNILSSTSMERWYLADYVERIPVKMGRAEGVWFIPKERGRSDPLPVVLDIRGIVPSLTIDRASILSSHGFAVFAYNYYHPLRQSSTEDTIYLKLSAFEDIIEYIKTHPRLDESRIGITSSCIGSSLSLHASSRLNLPIRCIVAAGFFDYLIDSIGLELPNGKLIEPYRRCFDFWQDHVGQWWACTTHDVGLKEYHDQVAPVENLDCPLLFLEHGDEVHLHFQWRSQMIRKKLEEVGKDHLLRTYLLPGTGHFLDTPYLPNCPVSGVIIPGQKQLCYTAYGGRDAQMNARDQVQAWRKVLSFFREHLGQVETFRSDWL